MKGIYVLENSLSTEDLYWICRARGIFSYLVVALSLSAGKAGKDLSSDISRVRKVLNNSDGLAIDFFQESELVSFLQNSCKTHRVLTDKKGVFQGIERSIDIPARLIVPGNNLNKYSSIDFPKYTFN